MATEPLGPNIASENEDDEDDDPAEEDDPQGACDEDEISCGPGNWGGLYSDFRYAGPGCAISDAGVADDGAIAEAHEVFSGARYGFDETRPLGIGHEP